MAAFLDVCRFTPTAGGTADWTFSAAATGYNSPALAGAVNGRAYKYRAESLDLSQWELGEGTYNTGTGALTRTTVLYNSSGTGTGAGQSGAGTKINFSTAPQVAVVALKEDLISIEEANSFTGAQKVQVLANIGFDAWRQNILLERIYQSKLFAGYRRFINAFADGYKASDGINSGSSSNYTANTSSGYVAPSLAETTTQVNANSGSGALNDFTYVMRDAAVPNSVTLTKIGAYSTSATTIVLKLTKRNSAGNYDIVTSQSFSHPGGGWSDMTLSSSQAIPGSGTYYVAGYHTASIDNSAGTAARSTIAGNQGVQTGLAGWTEATGVGPALRFVYGTGVNNMTLVTVSQTADASVSNGRVLLEYDNTAAPTLGTDLTAEVTCNGGTNWTAATLSSLSTNGQGGRKVVESTETACTAGTSFAARIKTLNNKNVPIYGVALTVR